MVMPCIPWGWWGSQLLVMPQLCLSYKIVTPQHSLPAVVEDLSSHITVGSDQVLLALRSFPQGSSPGGFRLRVQHLLDAISGTTVPAAQQCLLELTKWMNLLQSGRLHSSLSPWLGGAPLIALPPEEGQWYLPHSRWRGVRRQASRLCCVAVRSELPDIFLPYGQVGVGVKGGLEAAIHTLRFIIE